MPDIIAAPGEYRTRDGNRVTIEQINGPSSWPAKGYLWRTFRGKYRPRTWSIWGLDGSYVAVGEHPLDVVGPWDTAAVTNHNQENDHA